MNMLNSFMPKHEKEWEARLFIDEAIKNKAEYTLEAVARALSGKHRIEVAYGTKEKPFERKYHIKGDDDKWIEQTKKYLFEAKMREFVVHANTLTGIWLAIIKFWTEDKTIWPCGGAAFPNEQVECVNRNQEKHGESA